jgi:hypothetical protein
MKKLKVWWLLKVIYRLLLWQRKRAIKRHDTKAYFIAVGKLAKIDAAEMVKEKMKK